MPEDTNAASRRDVLQPGAAATGALLVGTATARLAAAATIRVGPAESIGDAVDEADPGDTVVVEGGTHREQVLVREDLALRGRDGATVAPPSDDLEVVSGLRPLVGAAGTDVEVTVEGLTVDGEGRDPGDFFTGVGYAGAGGRLRDVTVERTEFGGYVRQEPDEGSDQSVAVSGCRFEGFDADPLLFVGPGTSGRVFDCEFAGTPGTAQRALTAANGARVVAKRNEFEAVQYPAYLLAYAGSDAGSAAGRSRIVGNEAEGEDLPDDATSYGTVVSAYDPEKDDDTTETANDVTVIDNEDGGSTSAWASSPRARGSSGTRRSSTTRSRT